MSAKPLAADDPRHGTTNGYNNLKCRCQSCRDAWAEWFNKARADRERRLSNDVGPQPVHGLPATYTNWRCRCRPCTTAYSASKQSPP